MRSFIDFSSWQAVLSTLLGLVCMTLVAVGIRLVVMQRLQQKRERANRQINERLKTLIAAYKTLGGSFTGVLVVDPTHLRDLRQRGEADSAEILEGPSERARRTRDAVEAALSDVILLGTAEQVQMAAQAANDMVAGRSIETSALVASLRAFVREALGLEPIPDNVPIPKQGPLRTAGGAGGRGGGAGGPARTGGGTGGGGGGGTGGVGTGLAAGGFVGAGAATSDASGGDAPGPESRLGAG